MSGTVCGLPQTNDVTLSQPSSNTIIEYHQRCEVVCINGLKIMCMITFMVTVTVTVPVTFMTSFFGKHVFRVSCVVLESPIQVQCKRQMKV
jgi:hypothetical protein